MNNVIHFMKQQFIILICITLTKRIPMHHHSDEIIRMTLSHAKSNSMNPAEDNVALFLKYFYPEAWKSIVALRSFSVQARSDKSAVSTEWCLPINILSDQVINNIRQDLLYYFNRIYYLDADLFDNIPLPDDGEGSITINNIESFSEQRLRSIGGTQTRYPHKITIGQKSFVGQRFNDKPAHTTGLENRTIVGEIVDFHSHREKCYISISSKTNGKIETSGKLEYIPDLFDDLIRLAIKGKNTVRAIAEEKIDDKRNIYWGIADLSIL